jgi:hypothetical protein
LSTESRVDRHEKNNVKLVQDKFGDIKTSGWVKDKSSLASSSLNELKGSVNMVGGFRVEGDVRSSSINEVTDGGIDRGNHKVNINGGGHSVVTKGLADHRSDGKVGDVVVVHNVKVNNIGTSLEHIVDFLAQLGEIGRKNGRSDQIILISPNIQRSSRSGRLLRLKLMNKDSIQGEKNEN